MRTQLRFRWWDGGRGWSYCWNVKLLCGDHFSLCCWVWPTKWQLMSWAWWHGNLGDMKKPSWLDYSMIDSICEMIRFIDCVSFWGFFLRRILTVIWMSRICWFLLGVIGKSHIVKEFHASNEGVYSSSIFTYGYYFL
jgi:hypothetical protein